MRKNRHVSLAVLYLLFALLIPNQGTLFAHETHVHGHDAMHMESASPGSVVVNLETKPEKLQAGVPSELTFTIRDKEGNPLRDLTITHERLLHMIIVSGDFSTFAHIHPEEFGPITPEMKKKAEYSVRYTFPAAGRYLVAVDSAVKGAHFSEHFTVDVSGEPKMGMLKEDFTKEKRFGGYEVSFSTSPKSIEAGKEAVLKYVIKKDGVPIADLEPYLSAPMHLAVIKADLRNFIHAHGELPGQAGHDHPAGHIHGMMTEKFGPEIDAPVVFPVKGVYQVFGQIKHQDKVITTSFMVEVH
jgi:hypothetical protein